MKLKILLTSPDAKMPEVAHFGTDAGYDVFAAEEVEIAPGEQKIVSLGFRFEVDPLVIGNQEFPISLIAKQPSGLARKRSLQTNAGVLDSNFRGIVSIPLYNYGKTTQRVCIKDKISQLVPILTLTSSIEQVSELTETDRGEHGWGSGHRSDK